MKAQNFRVKQRKVVYSKGPIHLVDCLVRLSSGRTLSRQIIEHPGSVVIIPRFEKGLYGLVRQFRFAARCDLWEFPAGGMETGETLKQAAARELSEEIGYHPKQLKKLLSFYPSPGISSEVMHLYLAEKMIPLKREHDEDEEIEMKKFTARQIMTMISKKTIIDAKTILGAYFLKGCGNF